jgi:hypothetical protein
MIIFNSKRAMKKLAARSKPRVTVSPARLDQFRAATESAGVTLSNSEIATKERKKRKKRSGAYGIYMPDDTQGPAGGIIEAISGDLDDVDQLGNSKVPTLRDHLNKLVDSGEYSMMPYPYLALTGIPRLQRWMSAAKERTMDVYVHKSHSTSAGISSVSPTETYMDSVNLLNQLSAASKAGTTVPAKLKDIDDPFMRMLSDENGLRASMPALLSDGKRKMSDMNVLAEHCVCGTHKKNHGTGACKTFLPMVVPDGEGGFMDGNEFRSQNSPFRVDLSADGKSATRARYGNIPGQASKSYDKKNNMLVTLLTDSATWFRRISNRQLGRLGTGLMPKDSDTMTKKKDPSLKPCTSCHSTTQIYEGGEGLMYNPSMLEGMHRWVPSIDPVTGKKTLKRVSGDTANDYAVKGTPPNVCPDCDWRNWSDEELEEIARTVNKDTTPLTADQMRAQMRMFPGHVPTPGKPSEIKTHGNIRQEVANRNGAPVVQLNVPYEGSGIARGMPQRSCTECAGDFHYQKDGKPCDCTIADASSMSLLEPVALPGMPEAITPEGDILIPPQILITLMNNDRKSKNENLFGGKNVIENQVKVIEHELGAEEVILPNSEVNSPKAPFVGKPSTYFSKKYGRVSRLRGKFGTFSSWVKSDGKPALPDDYQQNVRVALTGTPVLSSDSKSALREVRKNILASPNAGELAPTALLRAAIQHINENLDTMAPQSGETPPIPDGAIAIPQNMLFVNPKHITSGVISVDDPKWKDIHKNIMPHVATITTKLAGLQKRGILDQEISADIDNIIKLASNAAKVHEETGAVHITEPGGPGISQQIYSSIAAMADSHKKRGGGMYDLQTIMPEIKEMIWPYVEKPEEIK